VDWNHHLDSYCERASPAFWAEPINAVTNLAFLVAAFVLWLALREAGALAPGSPAPAPRAAPASLRVLVVLVASIGVGSFVFHTVATTWSAPLDVVPIVGFIHFYVACYLHWFWQLRWRWAWLGVALFLVSSVALTALIGVRLANGSGSYLPALLGLIVFTAALASSRDRQLAAHWRAFAAAGVVFTLSLLARTVDITVCHRFPLGTHFVWHVLNAGVLFLLSHAAIRRWRELTPSR
jgi:hypothetical protein